LPNILKEIMDSPENEFEMDNLARKYDLNPITLYKFLSDKKGIFVDVIARGDKYYVKANPAKDIGGIKPIMDMPDLEKPPRIFREEYATKIEEIGTRFEHLKEIETQLPRIREVLLDAKPTDAFKSYLDQLGPSDDEKKRKLEKGFEFLTDKFIEPSPVPVDIESLQGIINGMIAGTDATRRIEFDIIRLGTINIPIALFFSALW